MQHISDELWLGLKNNSLVDVGTNHQLHCEVVNDFLAMQSAACKDGLDLQLVSSFRDFSRQAAIFNRKWLGQSAILDEKSQPLAHNSLSDTTKLHAILMWSALPGGSRHHWGTDFDVYDKAAVTQWGGQFQLIEKEYEPEGPCYPLACWLEKNMASFGFYRPFDKHTGGVSREPWHLSHRATSAHFEKARNLSAMHKAISNSNIEGKETILALLPSLFERYVLNKGNRES